MTHIEVCSPPMKTLVPKVRSFSEEHDLKLHGWPPDVGGNKFDLGVVASFGRLIPKAVIDAFPMSVASITLF